MITDERRLTAHGRSTPAYAIFSEFGTLREQGQGDLVCLRSHSGIKYVQATAGAARRSRDTALGDV